MGMFDWMNSSDGGVSLAERSAKHREEFPNPSQQIAASNKRMEELRQRGEEAKKVEPTPPKPYVPITYSPVAATLKSYT